MKQVRVSSMSASSLLTSVSSLPGIVPSTLSAVVVGHVPHYLSIGIGLLRIQLDVRVMKWTQC